MRLFKSRFFCYTGRKRGEPGYDVRRISNLYICIAFQDESALNQLINKGLVDKDLVDKSRNAFFESLDEEKLRTSQKIRSHTEIIRHYMRGMIS